MSNSFLWDPQEFFGLYDKKPLPNGKKSLISVAQLPPTDNVEDNLMQIINITESLVQKSASEMIVFPELALTDDYSRGHNAQDRQNEANGRVF